MNGKYIENGEIRYYQNDLLHREDGPAIEWGDYIKIWYRNGLCHRENGPAVEYANGDRLWYLNDVQCTEEEFNQWLSKKMLNEKLHSILEEKPADRKMKI